MTKEYKLTNLRALYMPGPSIDNGRTTKPVNFRNGKFRTDDKDIIEYLDNSNSKGKLYEEVKSVEAEVETTTNKVESTEQADNTPEAEQGQAKESGEEAQEVNDVTVIDSVTDVQGAIMEIKKLDPNFKGRADGTVRSKAEDLALSFPNWK